MVLKGCVLFCKVMDGKPGEDTFKAGNKTVDRDFFNGGGNGTPRPFKLRIESSLALLDLSMFLLSDHYLQPRREA